MQFYFEFVTSLNRLPFRILLHFSVKHFEILWMLFHQFWRFWPFNIVTKNNWFECIR